MAPLAASKVLGLNSLVAFAGVGAGIGRTVAVLRLFIKAPSGLPWNLDTVAGGALAGGLIGMLILVAISFCGVNDLPDWAEVPAIVVAVQAGFSLSMGYLLTKELGPRNGGLGPSHADFAFALYGAITLPGTALFAVTMIAINVVR